VWIRAARKGGLVPPVNCPNLPPGILALWFSFSKVNSHIVSWMCYRLKGRAVACSANASGEQVIWPIEVRVDTVRRVQEGMVHSVGQSMRIVAQLHHNQVCLSFYKYIQ
jgi:hypothetical protein